MLFRSTPEELDSDYVGDGEPIDAEFVVTPSPPVPANPPSDEPSLAEKAKQPAPDAKKDLGREDAVALATIWQRQRIEQLITECYEEDRRKPTLEAALTKRGVKCLENLLHDQAMELITKLEEKKAAMAAVESAKDMPPAQVETQAASAPVTTTSVNAPCTKFQEEHIKSMLRELEQIKPGSTAKFIELLAASGRKKIAEFTVLEADACINALGIKNLEAFFTQSLQKKVGASQDEIPF